MSVFAGVPAQPEPDDPLVSIDDFHEWFGVTAPTDADNARIQTALEIASSVVRGVGRKRYDKVDDEQVTVDGSGAVVLLLPRSRLPVRAVGTVIDDGTALAAADYDWSDRGVLRRVDGQVWTNKLRGVQVIYSHGYDPLPRAVAGVVLSIAKRLYDSPAGQGGTVQSETLGAYSVQYATGAAGGVGLTELETQILARY